MSSKPVSSKQFTLVGHPVSHSMSPPIHEAAYQSLGVSHRYSLSDCPARADVEAVVDQLRRGQVAGANVTVPHKRLAFELSDEQHSSAQATGVANVLSLNESGKVVAFNTDTIALAEELHALYERAAEQMLGNSTLLSAGAPPQAALVIGAGGAAQAAVVACRNLKIADVAVCRRSWSESQPSSTWDRAQTFEQLGARCVAWSAAPEICHSVDIIVQATSAGMEGAGPGGEVSDWIPWGQLRSRAIAYDVVYNPRTTPFLSAAKAAGVMAEGGLGMLVRQAAAAIGIWLGEVPPLPPLLEAAEASLRARGAG